MNFLAYDRVYYDNWNIGVNKYAFSLIGVDMYLFSGSNGENRLQM